MEELRLTLLGRPQVVHDDKPLTGWALQKSLALLAYLAVTSRAHSRGALAGLLWPDCTEANARSGLRKVVAELRHRVPSLLTISRAEIAFDRASAYSLDVEAFERGIGPALALRESPLTPAGAEALADALALCRGDFLAGLNLHRASAFDEWVLLEREHLRNLARRALHALVDYHVARTQSERALACLDRLLALEPADEEAHRHKMLLLAQGGQRMAALRQYEACCQAVHALDAEPDGETTILYERLRTGAKFPVPPRVSGHSLYDPLTPLAGRDAEVAELRARLMDPSCRLLTLVGPGGVGKTHSTLSRDMLSAGPLDGFEDGVYMIRMGSSPAVEALVPAIAQALDLPLSEGAHPQQQVVDYLYGRHLLLVMDGFEHLSAGAGLLADLLRTIPSLTILVTSRPR